LPCKLKLFSDQLLFEELLVTQDVRSEVLQHPGVTFQGHLAKCKAMTVWRRMKIKHQMFSTSIKKDAGLSIQFDASNHVCP
jgi:hypothetical protein